MSAEAVGWVWKFSPYKKVDRLIHLALADSANDMNDNEIWARQQWIADKAGVSRASVNSWIGQAVEDKFLELLEDNAKFGKPNRYRFLMPSDTAQLWEPRSGGVNSVDRGVSTVLTGGVNSVDTEPKGNPSSEPNPSDLPSSPSSNTVEDDNSKKDESVETISPVSGLSHPPATMDTGEDTTLTESSAPTTSSTRRHPAQDSAPEGDSTGRPSDARVVFDAWVEIMAKDLKRSKLTGERRTKINARLRSEFNVEDLIDAIRGAQANPWMMGQNDRATVYDDLTTILKNDASTQRHLNFWRSGAKATTQKPSASTNADKMANLKAYVANLPAKDET